MKPKPVSLLQGWDLGNNLAVRLREFSLDGRNNPMNKLERKTLPKHSTNTNERPLKACVLLSAQPLMGHVFLTDPFLSLQALGSPSVGQDHLSQQEGAHGLGAAYH